MTTTGKLLDVVVDTAKLLHLKELVNGKGRIINVTKALEKASESSELSSSEVTSDSVKEVKPKTD